MLASVATSASSMLSMESGGRPAFEDYLRHLSGQEKEFDVIFADHSYSRSWSCHPDSHHSKPAKLLFMKLRRQQPEISVTDDVIIDVEDVDPLVIPPYDNMKTRAMMSECDQFLQNSLNQESEESEQLNKNGWSSSQKSVHKQLMKILHTSYLSKLASVGTSTEVVKRKIMIEKAARRVRKLFASYTWDMTLLCWLHQTLMDSLQASMLSEYFEILRSLKAKVPNLIDKLLARVTTFHCGIFGSCSTEAFSQLIRKPWDPVLSHMTQNKPKKVAGNPLLVVVPNAPNQTVANQNQRMKFIMNQLGSLGKVIYSTVHSSNNMAVGECLDQIFTSTRSKVAELKNQHPARPIVLVGWTVGALLACHVALEESVAAVICFGFPLKGVSGSRGDLDDPLLDSRVPTLFLIGQNSNSCSMDDMEDFRERIRAETGLVVVGGADDMLRVSVTKKKTEGITQSMVDRCLVDEVGEFLSGILGQHSPSQSAQSRKPYVSSVLNVSTQHQRQQQQPLQQFQSQVADDAKRQRRRPREYSPEFSPVKRKPKPSAYQTIRKISASSSSDTSSTGSYAVERTSKREKKKSARKVGRPPLSLGKKRKVQKIVSRGGLKVKIPVMPPKKEALKPLEILQDKKIVQLPKHTPSELEALLTSPIPEEEPPSPPKPPVVSNKPIDTPKSLSLVNQQKNGPVDVEKAFGKDSSFLPRPLTPAEMDQAELPPESPDVNLGATSSPVKGISAEGTPAAEGVSTVKPLEVSFAATLSPDKKKVSFLSTNAESFPISTFASAISSAITIQSPQIITKIAEPSADNNKATPVVQAFQSAEPEQSLSILQTSSKIVTSQAPALLTGGTFTIKQLQNTVSSLAGKSLLTTSAGAFSKPQTILVTPSTSLNKQTAFLMAAPDGTSTISPKKIQVRRMVVKNPTSSPSARISVPLLSKLSAVSSTSSTSGESLLQPRAEQTFDSKVCNLSLLSDVAGMKEPIRHAAQELLNTSSSSATLVKLTSASDLVSADKRTVPSPIRRFRLIEAVPSSAFSQASQHVETPEEYAEKQMAIQALNSTLNEGAEEPATTTTSGSDGAFNVNYQKPSGSTRPYSMLGYSVVMPRPRDATVLGTRIPFRGARGRGANPFGSARKPRVQRFYPF